MNLLESSRPTEVPLAHKIRHGHLVVFAVDAAAVHPAGYTLYLFDDEIG